MDCKDYEITRLNEKIQRLQVEIAANIFRCSELAAENKLLEIENKCLKEKLLYPKVTFEKYQIDEFSDQLILRYKILDGVEGTIASSKKIPIEAPDSYFDEAQKELIMKLGEFYITRGLEYWKEKNDDDSNMCGLHKTYM